MSVCLPDLIDPRRAAAQEAVFEGELSLARLPRLNALLVDGERLPGLGGQASESEQARYRLTFGHDEDGRAVVVGNIRAELPLRCQRCNEGYRLPVDAPVRLALVEGVDEANALPDHYDPLLLDNRLMRPADLVEDELILAVPAIPRHPDSDCVPPKIPGADTDEGAVDETDAAVEAHPFAALAHFKARREDNE